MTSHNYMDLFEDLDDNDQTDNFLNKGRRRNRFPERHFKLERARSAEFTNGQDDSSRSFKFSYKAARFEEGWLIDSLGDFYEHKWISDVLRQVKGGKEASVYLCQAPAEHDANLLAAKVYRPRMLRNLKNDHQYRVGRADLDDSGNVIVDDGDLHAMNKRTSYGEELRHQSWIAYEFQTLEMLFEAGADVPKPYAMEKNAILMDYVGDLEFAAPTLNSVRLKHGEGRAVFERVIRNVDLLLSIGRIHGDLSAYNILYWEGEITIIDFPQVVPIDTNPSAWNIFFRDIVRVCQYFENQGVKEDPAKLAADLWVSHGYYRSGDDVNPSNQDSL